MLYSKQTASELNLLKIT